METLVGVVYFAMLLGLVAILGYISYRIMR